MGQFCVHVLVMLLKAVQLPKTIYYIAFFCTLPKALYDQTWFWKRMSPEYSGYSGICGGY